MPYASLTHGVSAAPAPRPRREGSKEAIRALLAEESDQGNRAVERAILVLFDRQTESEQVDETTKEHNGVGFNGADAPFLSSLAKWIKGSRRPNGQRLSPRQRTRARRQLAKYAGQLARIAAARADA
jgi:hypothetical protein